MMWLILTFLAVVSRAIYGVLTKVLSNHVKVGAMTQTTLLMVAGTIWGILMSPFLGGIQLGSTIAVWPGVAIAVATSALGNVFYFKGIVRLQSGTTQIAFSSILMWSVIMAWLFLGTHLTLQQGLGVLVLLFAIVLAQYQNKALRFAPGIWWILASAACFAGFQVVSAGLANHLTPGTYLVATYLGDALLIGLPYLATIRRDLGGGGPHLPGLMLTAITTGAASVLYNVFAYLAYGVAPNPGLVVLLLTSQVVLAVLLSVIFLKERDNIRLKLSAGVLALVAALMIKS